MKCIKLGPKLFVLVQILVGVVGASSLPGFDSESEDSAQEEEQNKQQQQGSWSRWWSYDGISGPDYWNINKRWRLCSSGRKQSPVDLLTEALVYDHLLRPIRLDWLPAGVSIEEAEREIARRQQLSSATKNPNISDEQAEEEGGESQRLTVGAQLLNSGRGFELWLEGSPPKAAKGSATAPPETAPDQLILSRGPLSYAYKLFKIELHAAPQSNRATGRFPTGAGPEALDPERTNPAGFSEHLIDGRSFDAELQLHFYNKHLAKSANQAGRMADEATSSSSNLFAAVSVFIVQRAQTLDANKSNFGNNSIAPDKEEPLDFMLNNVQSVPNEGQSIELQLTRAQIDALVADRSQYVTYQGSMNRPPCSESVDWIITNKPLRVQVNKFQNLFAASLKTLQDNVRPVRPLYRRQLRTTISNLAEQPSGVQTNRNEITSAQSGQTIADANCDLSTNLLSTLNRTAKPSKSRRRRADRTALAPDWNKKVAS